MVMGWGAAYSPALSRQALQAFCDSFGALGRKWDVQPGCVLGMATFTSFSGSLKEQVMMVGRWGWEVVLQRREWLWCQEWCFMGAGGWRL